MSIEATSAVWKHSKQRSGGLLVLLAIADYINKKGIAWPAVSTLAQKTRMSKRNVQRWISDLQRVGELKVLRNEGRRGTNIYEICLPTVQPGNREPNGMDDGDDAKLVTSVSSINDPGVIQSVNESLIESTPIVPKGEQAEVWIKLCFNCFRQTSRPLRRHIVAELARYIPILDRKNAESLITFYRGEPLDSKEPPYSSRRHSPERLILDLPRQVALAVRVFPPPPAPKQHDFTIEDVRSYLQKKYDDCPLPNSLEELDKARLFQPIRSEVYDAMRARQKNDGSVN